MIDALLPGMAALKNNLHPLLIHFPIAFFVGALIMEGAAVLRDEKFHFAATWMLYLGTFAALATLPTGFIAANIIAETDPRGHDAPGHAFIHVHRNWMVASTLIAAALSTYLFWVNQWGKWLSHRWGLLIGLMVLSAVVGLGADRGGRLVFEFGVGVDPAIIKEIPHPEGAEDHHHDD